MHIHVDTCLIPAEILELIIFDEFSIYIFLIVRALRVPKQMNPYRVQLKTFYQSFPFLIQKFRQLCFCLVSVQTFPHPRHISSRMPLMTPAASTISALLPPLRPFCHLAEARQGETNGCFPHSATATDNTEN